LTIILKCVDIMKTICKWRTNYNENYNNTNIPIFKIPVDCLQEIFYFVIEEKYNFDKNINKVLSFDEYAQIILPLFVTRGNKKYTMNVFKLVCKKWNTLSDSFTKKLVHMNNNKIMNLLNQIPAPSLNYHTNFNMGYSWIYENFYIRTPLFTGNIFLLSNQHSNTSDFTIKYQNDNDNLNFNIVSDPNIVRNIKITIELNPIHGKKIYIIPSLRNYKKEEFKFYNAKKWNNNNYKTDKRKQYNIHQPMQNNKY